MANGSRQTQADIFISFKNLDAEGKATRDSELAREVSDYLTSRRLTVFFSNTSLERLGAAEYTRAIDDALDAASVLIAVGTSREHLESKWVRYEWSSFFNDTLSGIKPDGRLFGYVEGITTRDLPRALRQNQVFIHEAGALEKLYNFIHNALGALEEEQPPKRKAELAYACYAASDREEVGKRIKAVEAMGTRVLTDLELRIDERWEEKLRRWIDQSDFMLLFWSQAASQSKSVEMEWRYALRAWGQSFIRPVYIGGPGPMPPPPRELAELHFSAI